MTTVATLRPATIEDAEVIGAVHVQCWRETYAGMLPEEALAALDPLQRAEMWRSIIGEGGKVWLATGEPGVVGFAAGGPQNDASLDFPIEIGALYVLRRAQRHGIGRRLMAAMAKDLTAAGFTRASLWVMDANTPAQNFYRALGGRRLISRDETLFGLSISATAYGWDDLAVLI